VTLAGRISAANDGDRHNLVEFWIGSCHLGDVRPEMARRLTAFADVFCRHGTVLRLSPALDHSSTSTADRTGAVERVLMALRDDGLIGGWRNERFALAPEFGLPALLEVERAALGVFGARGYGVHLNGLVERKNGTHMWLARRALTKSAYPGRFDQMVAGGQPAGLCVIHNLVKECAEEAGVDALLARTARATGTVSYCQRTSLGIQPGTLFVFDLSLPDDWKPVARDGEVAEFVCLPLPQIRDLLESDAPFKPNSALVALDCLIRHGNISPDEAGYAELLDALHCRR
jgi:8-oxo-dGTP pyrophosphatase MutT (NUDIX family)